METPPNPASQTPSVDLGLATEGPIGDDRRKAITSVCVHTLLATPAGVHIDKTKLEGYVTDRFDRLLFGTHFDITPLLGSLLAIDGVTERDLYVGFVNLMGALAGMGIEMAEPGLALSMDERRRIVARARAATEDARASFERRRLRDAVDELERQKLGGLMVAGDLISPEQLVAALAAQQQHGGRLGTNLVEMGFVTPAELARFLSEQLGLPCVCSIGNVAAEVLNLVPPEIATKHGVFPIDVVDDELVLAMADPGNIVAVEDVERESGRRVRPTIAPELMISYALARHYKVRPPLRVRQLPAPQRPAELESPGYEVEDLANDLARADDRYDVLAMVQQYLAERFRVSAVFDVADDVLRGFSSAGVAGDPRDVREHVAPLTGSPPADTWFAEALDVDEAIEIAVVIVEDEPAAVLVTAGAHDRGLAEHERMVTLASAAIRMVQLREEILSL